MKTQIVINNIARETEKAYLVNAIVNYNNNTPKGREIWMPKSLVNIVNDTVIAVESWFIDKLSWQNAFHGYQMNFEVLR